MPALGSIEDQERKRLLCGEGRELTAAQDLAHYLVGEFQMGEPMQVVTRRCDAVGRELSDRMVSRLEVVSAMRGLRYRQRRIMEMLYLEGLSRSEVADRLNISDRTLDRERESALEAMTFSIYEWR